MSKMSSFIQGFGLGERMVERYRAAEDRAKIREIAEAQPEQSQGFTSEDGRQLEALANAKDQQGNAFYLVGTDDKGNYTVAPNPAAIGMQEQPAAPVTISQKGVTDFLGQRTEGVMSPDQVMAAKQKAMAGVVMARDPVAGMRMLREQTNDERNDQRFNWEKNRVEREERTAAQTEADANALRELDADVGAWMGARLKNPDGTERPATVDDHLAASQYRAGKLMAAGKVAEAGQAMKDFQAQSFVKIQLETAERDKALGQTIAAVNAGNLDAARNFYNQYLPDGAKVTDIKRDASGKISIERTADDGAKLPPMVLEDTGKLTAVLSTLKDPMAVYNWTQGQFRMNMELRREARADRAEGRAAANQGRERAESKAKADAAVALFKEQNPGATPAQIEAVRSGVLPAVPKGGDYKTESGDVTSLLGTPAVDDAGKPLMDPMTGRQVVNRNPEREQAFFRFMRENGIRDTNEGLQKFITQGAGGGGGGGQQGRTVAKGQVVDGYEFLGGDPKNPKSWRQVSSGAAR